MYTSSPIQTTSTLKHQLEENAGKTNNILGDTEERIVKELLSGTQHHLSQLDTEITRIQKGLTDLLTQRQTYESKLQRFHIALSPQKRVPPEILSEIFLLCLPNAPVSLLPQLHTAPWVLGRVCSRWRAVALAEPRLWNRIGLDNYRAAHQRHVPALAREVFARGRHAAVTLACKARHYGDAVVELVDAHSTRIRELTLTLSIQPLMTLLTRPPGGWDNLEAVTMEFYREPVARIEDQLEKHVITTFQDAPRLKKVAFRVCGGGPSITLRPGTQFEHIPWAQITDLSFTTISPAFNVLLDILSRCESLVRLEVALNDGVSVLSKAEIPDEIVLPALESLKVDIRAGSSKLPRLLCTLVAPTLKSFAVLTPPWNSKWPQAAFLNFLSNSGCALESVFLKSVPILAEDYESLLYSLPTLKSAVLSSTAAVQTSVIEAMAVGEVLPVLEELECRVVSTGAVLDMLEARWPGEEGTWQGSGYKGITRAVVCADEFGKEGDRARALEPTFARQGRSVNVFGTVH